MCVSVICRTRMGCGSIRSLYRLSAVPVEECTRIVTHHERPQLGERVGDLLRGRQPVRLQCLRTAADIANHVLQPRTEGRLIRMMHLGLQAQDDLSKPDLFEEREQPLANQAVAAEPLLQE